MMKKQMNFRFLPAVMLSILTMLVLAACASQPSAAQSAAAGQAATSVASGQPVSFAKDITPILQTTCISCHGGEKTSKGLDLKTYASLMTGSQSGAVITPGDAAKSMLVVSVQAGKMPKRGAPLSADQIQLLVNWVNAGAKNN